MTHRYQANGQSGGRGADVWVLLDPSQAAWLARNLGGSLTVMSKDGEVVRISCVREETAQASLLPSSMKGEHHA